MPAHRIKGRIDFQGLPVSVENPKGSARHWKDEGTGKVGTTIMKYPYGYVRGTMGTDGDAVDVFVGKNKKAPTVYVITQNKAPKFREVDEQKVMLGFDTPEQAKLAYLAHYTTGKFFRTMKEMPVGVFKEKLQHYRGKLIKGVLLDCTKSVKMGDNMSENEEKSLSVVEPPDLMKNKTKLSKGPPDDRGEEPRNIEDFDGVEEEPNKRKNMLGKSTASGAMDDVAKALSARVVSSLAKRARLAASVAKYEQAQRHSAVAPGDVPLVAGIAGEQPGRGTQRAQDLREPPVVPVRKIHMEAQPLGDSSVYKSCTGCGRMNKSLSCVTCDSKKTSEATPLWSRQ
jgi:hypothetical protein